MFIAFLPRLEAQEALERHHENETCLGEMEADYGSSFFYSGASSWEASAMARSTVNEWRRAYDESPEGERFAAEVEAAQFLREATYGLEVVSVEEINDPRIFVRIGAPVVPEFYPDGPNKGMFYTTAPCNEDIPF